MQLVIVESPAKAKTIEKYLGGDYRGPAPYGHGRDGPARDGTAAPETAPFESPADEDAGKKEPDGLIDSR